MIRFEHLSKTLRGRCALDDLTLEIAAGEVFGLLGQNGAGKSTALGLLLGQFRPTRGEAFIRGISVQRDRVRALQRVGAIFETPAFYEYLSGWTNLRILASFSGPVDRAAIGEVVRFVRLEERIHDRVRDYSHGMKQRLALAQALLPRPDVVLLDEPGEGLDPEGIRDMRRLVLRLNREQGMTVLLCSHLLSEVEQLCSRVAFLDRGKLVFQGRWSELGQSRKRFRLEIDNWERARPVLQECGAMHEEPNIVALSAQAEISDLIAELVRGGVKIRGVEPLRQTLEELYLGTVAQR